MQTRFRHVVATAIVTAIAALATPSRPLSAAVFASENFNDFTLDPAFAESTPGAYTYDARAAQEVGPSRSYIHTVDSDYNTIDFIYEVTYTVHLGADGSGIAFVGIGSGVPGDNFFEPDQGVYTRHWPSASEEGSLLLVRTSGDETSSGPSPDEETELGKPGDGRHRARLSKVGDLLTFAIDEDYYDGPFVPDYTTSRSLSADAPYLNAGNSRLFFGTEAPNATFDDVTIVPEPVALGLLGAAAFLGLARRRRAR